MHDQSISSLGIGAQLLLDGRQQRVVECKRWDRGLPMTLPVSNSVCDRIGKLTTCPSQYCDGDADG